jgi:hypothetical protein
VAHAAGLAPLLDDACCLLARVHWRHTVVRGGPVPGSRAWRRAADPVVTRCGAPGCCASRYRRGGRNRAGDPAGGGPGRGRLGRGPGRGGPRSCHRSRAPHRRPGAAGRVDGDHPHPSRSPGLPAGRPRRPAVTCHRCSRRPCVLGRAAVTWATAPTSTSLMDAARAGRSRPPRRVPLPCRSRGAPGTTRRTCGSTGTVGVITRMRWISALPGDRTTAQCRQARPGRTARPAHGRLTRRSSSQGAGTQGRPRRAGGRSPQSRMPCRPSRPPRDCWHRQQDAVPQGRRPKSCAAAHGSGRSSRRSRNTIRVKPYAIRSPSRNASHTALRAPGGSIPTSGCSRRYRSSLRTWSGGPGGTSCTGQYRYPVSGPRNRVLKTRATRRGHRHPPPTRTCRRPSQTPASPPNAEPPPGSTPKWLTPCRYHQAPNSHTPER